MKEKLKRYISDVLLSDRADLVLSEEENLLGTGLLDSVGMMTLVLFVEKEFELTIPPQDVTIEHFLSIDTIAAYLRKRLAPT